MGNLLKLVWYPLYPLGSLLVKFGFAAIIRPISIAHNSRSDDYDLEPDLDMTCDLFAKIFNFY